jgi:hypothetical protein
MTTMRKELEDEIAKGNERSSMILRHRNHIINNIVTLKCPRRGCGTAWFFPDNFQACFALTCNSCGCGYCGWCLQDCGNDAHHHVPGCRPGLEPRGLFPPGGKKDFDKVHGPRRRDLIYRYLDEQHLQGKDKDDIIKSLKEISGLKDDNIIL